MESQLDEPDLRSYLGVIARRRWLVIFTTLVFLGIAVAVSLIPEPEYRVRAQVLTTGVNDPVSMIFGNNNAGDLNRQATSQLAFLTSSRMRFKAAERLQRLAVQGRGVQGVGAARRHRRQRQHLQRRRAVAGVDRPGGRGHDGQRLRPDLRRAARERRPRAPDQDQGPAPGAGAAVRVPAGHAPPADHRHRGRDRGGRQRRRPAAAASASWRRTWPTRSSRSRRRSPRSTRRSAASTWASSWRPAAAPRC